MSNAEIAVRLARPEDWPALNAVMKRASISVETGEVLRRLLDEPEHLQVAAGLIISGNVVLAEADGAPIGFASFVINGSRYADLDGMFVDPIYWRRGVGTMLYGAVEHELVKRQSVGVRVMAGPTAVPFYMSVGFAVVGEQRTPLGPIVPVMTKVIT